MAVLYIRLSVIMIHIMIHVENKGVLFKTQVGVFYQI